MHIYQIKTPQQFKESFKGDTTFTEEEIMSLYAKDVATKFAAECVNEALGNKMEVSNALHSRIESMYKSIIWENEG